MSAPRRGPPPVSRRQFLRRAAALSAVAASGALWTPLQHEAWARTRGSVARPEGTTLERFIWFEGGDELARPAGYRRLRAYAPGWPIEVRAELAEPKRGREGRRIGVAALHHGTDYQFPDAQSPARVEWLARYADEPTPSFLSSAQRPQEALIVQATEALHRRLRELALAPVTGRRMDLVMTTGDNYDNKQYNELQWFLTLMNGGLLAANSGAGERFEGVQTFDGVAYDDWYYHPDDDLDLPPGAPRKDRFKRSSGYPDLPGLLDAAIRPFEAAGVGAPWYQTYGNHDALVQGNERVNDLYAEIAVGGVKHLHPAGPVPNPGAFWRALMANDPDAVAVYLSGPAVEVTADADRRFIFDRDYVTAHLEAAGEPAGHGFTEWNLDTAYLFYTFEVAEGVRGISLDTCGPVSSVGAIGDAQLRWLAEQLAAVHSRHSDPDGNEVRTGHDDELVIVFGHHRFDGMEPMQSPRQVGGPDDEADAPDTYRGPDGYVYRLEQQHGGEELRALLHRFPNVVAYVNGHSHVNRITPHPDPAGRSGGIWEITTSAVLDPPQHGRVIELADNRDGTLSIFCTLIDHAGPPAADDDDDVLALASRARELAFNDPQAGVESKVGGAGDRNVELLAPAPFRLSHPPERAEPPTAQRPRAGTPSEPLPAAGGGLLGLGAAALAGAVALRRRGGRGVSEPSAARSGAHAPPGRARGGASHRG